MTRFHVHVVQMRARDVRKGDVVARDPSRQDGWFRVHEVKALPDGNINILDKGNVRGFLAGPFDLIGLQTPVQLPAEADATTRRREHELADAHHANGAIPVPSAPANGLFDGGTNPAATAGTGPASREAAAATVRAETEQVRGSLPQ